MHAGCMQAACRLHAACIRSYAGGCRLQHPACSLHAGCMQAALRFKCSRLHWNTRAHSRRRRRVPGVDALHYGVDALHTGVDALHAGCKQAACRASTPRKYAENEHAHSRRIFQSVFVYFSLWHHVLMLSRCHLRPRPHQCLPSLWPNHFILVFIYFIYTLFILGVYGFPKLPWMSKNRLSGFEKSFGYLLVDRKPMGFWKFQGHQAWAVALRRLRHVRYLDYKTSYNFIETNYFAD